MRQDGGVQAAATTDVTRAILGRRSIRSGFVEGPLPDAVVEEIVACGLAAPSSKNSQPWRLHVVTDRELLRRIAGAVVAQRGVATYVPHDPATGAPRPEYRSTVLDSSHVLAAVPLAVFVENLGPFSRGVEGLVAVGGSRMRSALFGFGLEMVGVGAAIENMWLAATALGLSAALLGDVAIAEGEIARTLGLRGDLVGALAIGHSDDSPYPPMDSPAFPELARAVRHPGAATKTP